MRVFIKTAVNVQATTIIFPIKITSFELLVIGLGTESQSI